MKLIKYLMPLLLLAASIGAIASQNEDSTVVFKRCPCLQRPVLTRPAMQEQPLELCLFVSDNLEIGNDDALFLAYSSSTMALKGVPHLGKLSHQFCGFRLKSDRSIKDLYHGLSSWKGKSITLILFEGAARKVVEYFNQLTPQQQKKIKIDLLVIIEGEHTPESCAALESNMFKRVVNIYSAQHAEICHIASAKNTSSIYNIKADVSIENNLSLLNCYKKIPHNTAKHSPLIDAYPFSAYGTIISNMLNRSGLIKNGCALENNFEIKIKSISLPNIYFAYELSLFDSTNNFLLNTIVQHGTENKLNQRIHLTSIRAK